MDRKKVYYHIDCSEHGTEHSLCLLDAVRHECDIIVTLCQNFLAHKDHVYDIFGIKVRLPTTVRDEMWEQFGSPPDQGGKL